MTAILINLFEFKNTEKAKKGFVENDENLSCHLLSV